MRRTLFALKKQISLVELSNKLVILWLFLAFTNFITREYIWLYIALGIFMLTPQRKIKESYASILSSFFLTIMGVSMLIFSPDNNHGVTDMLKPFAFLSAYTIGIGIASGEDETEKKEQRLRLIIYICTFGFFTHYILNMLSNSASLERDTIDYWSGTVLSATGQATFAVMVIAVVAAKLFSEVTLKQKLLAGVLAAIVMMYNLVLAGRTLLIVMIIAILLAFLYRYGSNKKGIIKGLIMIVATSLVILVVYNNNLFNIKTIIESSNLYIRLFERNIGSVSENLRFEYKLVYLEQMPQYIFGGGMIKARNFFYAHDIYLDGYDHYSIFFLIALAAYMVSTIIRLFKCLRSPALSFNTKILVFNVYAILNIQFWIEPIFQGTPFLFAAYCLIDGVLSYILASLGKYKPNKRIVQDNGSDYI